MKKKEIINSVLKLLSDKVESTGFSINLKDGVIIKKDVDAILIYDVLWYDRVNQDTNEFGFQAEPYVYIHNRSIESVYKEVSVNKFLKIELSFKTIGNSVADLEANPKGIYEKRNNSVDIYVFNESQIEKAAVSLFNYFRKTALPYFDKYAAVGSIDEALNSHPSDYCVHMPNDNWRIVKGLIAARLNNNSRYEKLHRTYYEFMDQRSMPKETFEELRNLTEKFRLVD